MHSDDMRFYAFCCISVRSIVFRCVRGAFNCVAIHFAVLLRVPLCWGVSSAACPSLPNQVVIGFGFSSDQKPLVSNLASPTRIDKRRLALGAYHYHD